MFSWEQDDLSLVMKQCESDMADQIQGAIKELEHCKSGFVSYDRATMRQRVQRVCSKPFYHRLKGHDAYSAQCKGLEDFLHPTVSCSDHARAL